MDTDTCSYRNSGYHSTKPLVEIEPEAHRPKFQLYTTCFIHVCGLIVPERAIHPTDHIQAAVDQLKKSEIHLSDSVRLLVNRLPVENRSLPANRDCSSSSFPTLFTGSLTSLRHARHSSSGISFLLFCFGWIPATNGPGW